MQNTLQDLTKVILRYRQNIVRAAKLSVDQPMTGLQRAIWWTEYVLRGRTTKHLRGTAAKISVYKYYLLDIIGFVLLVFTFVLYLSIKLLLIPSCKLQQVWYTKCKLKTK